MNFFSSTEFVFDRVHTCENMQNQLYKEMKKLVFVYGIQQTINFHTNYSQLMGKLRFVI